MGTDAYTSRNSVCELAVGNEGGDKGGLGKERVG